MKTATVDSDKHTYAEYMSSKGGDLFAKTSEFRGFLDDVKSRGTYSYHRPLVAAHGGECRIRDDRTHTERSFIMLSSNSYLGLHIRPEVIEASCEATRRYGSGMCGSRLLCGTYDLVENLELELADFECKEAAMVFTTGYQANVGVISALLRSGDVAFIDRLSHASIVEGCAVAGCDTRVYRHNDVEHLDRLMTLDGNKHAGKLVITESVFSMDGDTAPLQALAEVARRHGARILVDEAHATGVLGRGGRGLAEVLGIEDEIDITVGTFSKALGATGGFIAASRDVVEYVRHYGRSYIFSASPCPGVIAAAHKALSILRSEPQLRETLWRNIQYYHQGMKARGMMIHPDPAESGVMTLLIGEDIKLRDVSKAVYENGLFVSTVTYPAVSRNQGRLRMSISASHTIEQLDRALDILQQIAQQYHVV